MKENITNKAPEGYVFDKKNSDLENGVVVWKPKPEITYDVITREILWSDRKEHKRYCLIREYNTERTLAETKDTISLDNIKKVLAYNKLLNIATYLNEGWKPDFNNTRQQKWYITRVLCNNENSFYISYIVERNDIDCMFGQIFFANEDIAEKAIKIMGDDLNYLFD